MSDLLDLAARWREEARTLRERYGLEQLAQLCETHAHELAHVVTEAAGEELTLAQASAASGYSERRLRELVTEGRLHNVGRKHAPRFRRADLPRKPGAAGGGFDPEAEAAAIAGVGAWR